MKKLRLKKWVEYTLVSINTIMFFVMASDCESTMTFITSHVIALSVFSFNAYVLAKYTDLFSIED